MPFSYLMETYKRLPVKFIYGKGVYLYDEKGKEYIDLIAGIGVNSLGYAHPKLVSAICEQAKKLIHISNLFEVPFQEELAKKLVETAYGREGGQVFFTNSGTEANEALIKLIRKYFRDKGKDKYEIITFTNSFHGRTYGSLSATAQPKFHKGFEPLLPGFKYAPFNDLTYLKKLVNKKTAGILIELIQGEGGINEADKEFIKELYNFAKENEILFAVDEVQTGNGRTGKYWSFQHYEIVPDLFTTAKGLGGGLPIGALIAKKEIAQHFTYGTHGSTFGGNPLAIRSALVVYEELENGLLEKVQKNGKIFKKLLKDLNKGTVKGKGLMLGLEISKPCNELVLKGLERGIVFNCTAEKVLRFLPPLIIEEEEIYKAVEILREII